MIDIKHKIKFVNSFHFAPRYSQQFECETSLIGTAKVLSRRDGKLSKTFSYNVIIIVFWLLKSPYRVYAV